MERNRHHVVLSEGVSVSWSSLRTAVEDAYTAHQHALSLLLDDLRSWQSKYPDEVPDRTLGHRIEDAARRLSVALETADALERSETADRLVIHGWRGRNIDSRSTDLHDSE